jgi:hypothetical protein
MNCQTYSIYLKEVLKNQTILKFSCFKLPELMLICWKPKWQNSFINRYFFVILKHCENMYYKLNLSAYKRH